MVKLTYVLYCRTDLAEEEARRLWMEEHGAMMERYAGTLRVVKYVQTPRHAHPLEDVMAAARGIMPPRPLGMAEIYWKDWSDFEFSFSDPAARRAYRELVEDEKRFAQAAGSPWLGVEREVIGQ